MNATIHTLFVLFYFPPFPRVGGRRWAKHIKYFQKCEERFHVLAGDHNGESPWDADIRSYKEKITRIPVSVYYPFFKQKLPESKFEKIKWKYSLLKNRLLEKAYKGNFWDDSRGYERIFYIEAKKIISAKKITHVCLSVGPFSYAMILPALRKEFPDLKITLDFRDYWEDSFDSLSLEKINEEKRKLAQVMKCVDLVLAPNLEMSAYYGERFKKSSYCLPHCIDEDYQNVKLTEKRGNEKRIQFLYGGTLYSKLENYMLELTRLMTELQGLGYESELIIYTMQPNYTSLLDRHRINYTISDQLPTPDFINAALKSDVILLFRPDWSPNGFSTKFFEALALRRPLLYFGPKGEVNRFIQQHNLGFALEDGDARGLAERIIANVQQKSIPDKSYPLTTHTFEYQTRQFISCLRKQYVA